MVISSRQSHIEQRSVHIMTRLHLIMPSPVLSTTRFITHCAKGVGVLCQRSAPVPHGLLRISSLRDQLGDRVITLFRVISPRLRVAWRPDGFLISLGVLGADSELGGQKGGRDSVLRGWTCSLLLWSVLTDSKPRISKRE